jgi:hypothetical protein
MLFVIVAAGCGAAGCGVGAGGAGAVDAGGADRRLDGGPADDAAADVGDGAAATDAREDGPSPGLDGAAGDGGGDAAATGDAAAGDGAVTDAAATDAAAGDAAATDAAAGDAAATDAAAGDAAAATDAAAGDAGAAPGCGFGPGASWPLPSEFADQFGLTADQASCSSAPDVLHVLTDLDGDGRPDLVVTSGCAVDASIGTTRWRVFHNTGSGFAAGVDWALPAEFSGQFGLTADQASCSSAPDVLHVLTDLDGDGRPDLVVTGGCAVDATIGTTRWRVFHNTGSGFAAAGTDWALPAEHSGQFGRVADQASCSSAPDVLHALSDLDGDGRPDLVVTSGCAVDATIGTTHWRVFHNTGSGFAATGADWALPGEHSGQFGLTADQASCSSAPDVLHVLTDLDGDGAPDLVVTSGCAVDATIGTTRWRVFHNTGSGFAAAGVDWALPAEHVGQFGLIADQASCSSAPDVLHLLTDLDGDGAPDLVVTSGCAVDATIGTARWRVFHNTGSGFGAAGTDWALPAAFSGQFALAADQASCSSAPDVLHVLTGLTGPGPGALVVTDGCATAPAIGSSEWRVFPGACH